MTDQLRTLVYRVEMNTDGAEKGSRQMQLTMKTMEKDAGQAGKSIESLAKKIDTQYNTKTKVMVDNTKSAKAELKAMNTAANRSEQSFQRVSREYQFLASKIGKTAQEQEIMNAQFRLGAGATKKQKDEIERLIKTYQAQNVVTNKGQKSMRGFRGQMQNIGFQAQDIAVQMQMGTNAMTIFSQQGSQLAAGFGPTGAIVGAGIAFAGMLGSLLLPNLMKTGDGIEDLTEKLEDLAKSTGLTREQANILVASKVDLIKESVKSAKEIQKEIDSYQKGIRTYEEYEKAQLEVLKTMQGIKDATPVIVKSQEQWTAEQIKAGKENKKRIGELQTLQSTIGSLQKEIDVYNAAVGTEGTEVQRKWSDGNKSLTDRIVNQAKQVGKTRIEVLQYEKAQAAATLEQQNATEAQKEAVSASFDLLIANEKIIEAEKKRVKLEAEMLKITNQRVSVAKRIGTDELEALEDKYKEEQKLFEDNEIALTKLREEYEKNRVKITGTSFEKYLVAAEEQLNSFDGIVENSLSRLTSGFGNAFADSLFESESFGEAFGNIFESAGKNMVAFFAEWAAQEAALWLIKKTLSSTAQTSAATTTTANAEAGVLQAGLNAFQSTAAIPIVGPSLAPAAAAAAVAATQPMASAISALSFAGVFDKGGVIPQDALGIVAEYGNELVNGVLVKGGQGGTRVTSREETNNLLNRGGDNFNVTVNGGSGTPDQIARALVRELNKRKNKQMDNAIFEASNRGSRNKGKRYGT